MVLDAVRSRAAERFLDELHAMCDLANEVRVEGLRLGKFNSGTATRTKQQGGI